MVWWGRVCDAMCAIERWHTNIGRLEAVLEVIGWYEAGGQLQRPGLLRFAAFFQAVVRE